MGDGAAPAARPPCPESPDRLPLHPPIAGCNTSMPTSNSRLMITLTPTLRVALEDLADATERPMSRVIVEMLQEFEPAMPDLARLARMAKQGKKRAAMQQLARMNADAVEQGRELQKSLPLARPRQGVAAKSPKAKPKRRRSG